MEQNEQMAAAMLRIENENLALCMACDSKPRLSWRQGGFALECIKRFDGCPMNARTHRSDNLDLVIERWQMGNDAPPLDMIIFCPNCGRQHIDRPDPEIMELAELRKEYELSGLGDRPQSIAADKLRRLTELEAGEKDFWTNPIHRSHTCREDEGGCGAIFRMADIATNGVLEIETRGEKDTWHVTHNYIKSKGDFKDVMRQVILDMIASLKDGYHDGLSDADKVENLSARSILFDLNDKLFPNDSPVLNESHPGSGPLS